MINPCPCLAKKFSMEKLGLEQKIAQMKLKIRKEKNEIKNQEN